MPQWMDLFKDLFTVSKDWLKSHTIMAGIVFLLLLISFIIVNYAVVDFGNLLGIFFYCFGFGCFGFFPCDWIDDPYGNLGCLCDFIG